MGTYRTVAGMRSEDTAVHIAKEDTKRSDQQNRLMWCYNEYIGKQMIPPQDKDSAHLFLCWAVNGKKMKNINGMMFPDIPKTSKFSIKRMNQYLLEMEVYALTHAYDLPAPPYRDLALYGEK